MQLAICSDLDIRVTDITGLGSGPLKTMTMRQIYSMEKSKSPPKIKVSVILAENKAGTSKPLLFKCRQPLTILRTEEVTSSLPRRFPKERKGGIFLTRAHMRARSLGKAGTFTSFLTKLWLCTTVHSCFLSPATALNCTHPLAPFTERSAFLLGRGVWVLLKFKWAA